MRIESIRPSLLEINKEDQILLMRRMRESRRTVKRKMRGSKKPKAAPLNLKAAIKGMNQSQAQKLLEMLGNK
jgi:hypothetical protein